VELRRIERDLHDGAQARLVALAMSLGMAEEEIIRDPGTARQLVAEARETASTALAELRDLVRGIYPPVLSERGLGGAVEALALASVVPIDVDVALDQRLAAPLESALYFVIAEAVDTGAGLLDALAELDPDVAVVDVRLPPTFTDEGLRAAIEARRRRPGFPILILSQYVEQLYARELLSDGAGGVGYLLKDRVGDVRQFVEAVQRVADGGTAMDPEVISQILSRRSGQARLTALTPREREVLALMAEGRTNAAIARRLVITDKAVSKHISNIFTKLGLPPSEDDHRRVLAVLTHLNLGA